MSQYADPADQAGQKEEQHESRHQQAETAGNRRRDQFAARKCRRHGNPRHDQYHDHRANERKNSIGDVQNADYPQMFMLIFHCVFLPRLPGEATAQATLADNCFYDDHTATNVS